LAVVRRYIEQHWDLERLRFEVVVNAIRDLSR